MNRREFIALAAGPATGLLAGASGWPIAARSQQQAMRRIGQMFGYAESDPEGRSRLEALQEKLKELGWIEGRNIELVIRRTLGRPELTGDWLSHLDLSQFARRRPAFSGRFFVRSGTTDRGRH